MASEVKTENIGGGRLRGVDVDAHVHDDDVPEGPPRRRCAGAHQ